MREFLKNAAIILGRTVLCVLILPWLMVGAFNYFEFVGRFLP
jgi:hypothetical protein